MTDKPIASRPTVLPDVAVALDTIAHMKRGAPISPDGIQAIVALAEEGAAQLEQFDIRWAADMCAVEAWRAAHPGNDLVIPDHADLVVWLMDVLDCSFDRPTVDQVEHVRARLGAAYLRMPNALTKDARDIIDQLTDALRKMTRRAFMAEARLRDGGDAPIEIETIAGPKNTVDYDRRQLQALVNDRLSSLDATADDGEVGSIVADIAPGWQWTRHEIVAHTAPSIVLIRYAPGEPL